MAERALQSGGHLSGITTGLDGLNGKIGGLHKSDLVILAGRPAMGKTALATNLAFSAALRSEEHTSELQSLMRISYAVFCLKKKKNKNNTIKHTTQSARK